MKNILNIGLAIILLHSNLCIANHDINNDFKNHSITFLGAIGSYESINLILKRAKIIGPNSYFIGVGYRSPEVILDAVRLNIELLKHFHKQQSLEMTLYPSIESKDYYVGNLGFSWGIGDGISTMLGPYPKFEVYRTVKTRRILNFLVVEQNIFMKDKPQHKITIRWHHRCHCFNAIAPKGSGANFFGAGFRYSF